MGQVRQYTLSDEETEQWQAKGAEGREAQDFIRRSLSSDEPRGTRIEIRSAWGDLLETVTV